ncbi:hypothetical protein GJU04_01470 [Enterobacteriaceae endosymbiont of Donacia marginata]|uniref:DNA polymerase III subunit delta n=1 Tax=Enterobacteriaceae endosymbiont of Donacia marginata TaxID=2675779 RepID=UPI001448AADC|nr:hypothetical protein [Enterobacteriaceae endosymbiont of Donacia marginata]QJC38212.1 hypothetical protein GJU04_01470 [Enterobacteriaceae endosymbiont of Donacia marginata]
MNKIFLKKIYADIYNKKYYCYIIMGSELFFIKKNITLLLKKLVKLNFIKNNIIIIDDNTLWESIFSKFIIIDFFCKKQIIHLIFLNKKNFLKSKKNINTLIKYIGINNILILEIHDYINLYIEKNFNNIINNKNIIIYKFNKLNNLQLLNWIYFRFKQLNLFINKNICILLHNFYSKNLMLLNQVLENIYIQKKNHNYLNNLFFKKNNNLNNSILEGTIKDSLILINQMKKNKQNIFIIFNKLQKNIFLIFKIYRNLKKYPLNIIFKKFLILPDKQNFFIKILKKINNKKIYLIIKLLLEIEINLKSFIINNYTEKYFWIDIERLILFVS